VESLVIAGAFDELDSYHRAQYFDVDNAGRTNIEKLLRYGQSFQDNKNSVENSLFADFADEVQIERPKLLPCAEWQNMHKLNREKEIIGFYLSAHPLDEYKFQYQFMNGEFSKNFVLDDKKKINTKNDLASKILDEETDEEESLDISLEVSEDEELVEESSKKAEPKGNFNFLNLDEIDALKNNYFLREVFLSLQKIGKKDKNNLIMLENTRFLA
jgi:DNA polymerase-3 subunit alpha